jgi:hypothetical protein
MVMTAPWQKKAIIPQANQSPSVYAKARMIA